MLSIQVIEESVLCKIRSMRVAIGMRLGSELCQPHRCPCGALADTLGSHALSCRQNSGRTQRHHYLNDLVWRTVCRAGIPSVKAPHGLVRSDGKRPDGLALVPWQAGRCATWDVTVTYTVADSFCRHFSRLRSCCSRGRGKPQGGQIYRHLSESSYLSGCIRNNGSYQSNRF